MATCTGVQTVRGGADCGSVYIETLLSTASRRTRSVMHSDAIVTSCY